MKNIFHFCSLSLCAAALSLATFSTHARIIPNVTIDSVTSELESFNRLAAYTVSDSGLFGTTHTFLPNGTMWLNLGTFEEPHNPANETEITFDLGAVHSISGLRVWNYNEMAGQTDLTTRGIATANILVAGEDGLFTTHIAGQAFDRAPGTLSDFSQTIDMDDVQARYVRIQVLANHGDGSQFAGLSKVQFLETDQPLELLSADRKFSNRQVAVHFSEAVEEAGATDPANYSITANGATIAVTGAAIGHYRTMVILDTADLDPAQTYTLTVNSVRDASGTASVAEDAQVVIGSQLRVWLRADAGVTANGWEPVAEWADQSGYNHHAAQVSEFSQPLFIENEVNGNPVLRFDGVDDHFEIAHTEDLVFHEVTVVAVVRVNDYSVHHGIAAKNVNNLPAPFDFYLVQTSGLPQLFRGNGAGQHAALGGSAPPTPGQFHVLTAGVRGVNASHSIDGILNGTGILQAPVADGGEPLRIGGRYNSTGEFLETRLYGDLAEIMIFNAGLSTEDKMAVESYLGEKYGIDVTVLSITEHPQDATVLEGRTVTFTVEVTASTDQISYQWQRNGEDIPGATDPSYTTPLLTVDDSGSTYRVVVTIPATSQVSEPATVTVLADTEPPVVAAAGVHLTDPTRVVVQFDEAVDEAGATDPANYSFDQGVSVTSVSLHPDGQTVTLITSGIGAVTPTLTISAVEDLFGNAMPGTQVSLGVYPFGLVLWLRADEGVTADGDGLVDTWNDQSGEENHASQPFDVFARPQLVGGEMNGHPVIRFDGADDYLRVEHSESMSILGDMTVYVVARFTDFANFNGIIGKTAGPAGNLPAPYDFYTVAGSGIPRFFRGNGEGVHAFVDGTAVPTPGEAHILSVIMGGTAVAHFLDGAANGGGTLSTTIADGWNPVGIGSRFDLVTKMKGDFAEMLVFNTAISDEARHAIDVYLGEKYGIAVAGPPVEEVLLGASLSESEIIISWPADAPGFILESTVSLSEVNWTPVTAEVEQVDGRNQVRIAVEGAMRYFRLRGP